jgi:iron complex outermembrane receptor protein
VPQRVHAHILFKKENMNMKSPFLILIYWVVVTSLTAQEVSDTISIEQITISASRAAASDPISFQNISIREINQINIGQDPVAMLQSLSPSILTYSDGGTDIGNYSQFRLRGIDQDRVNITLNGVPLNDMVDQGVYFSNFSDFGNSIQSIQVQRGVASSQYGTASYAGAVNFESINLFKNEPSGEIQLLGGSFGTERLAVELETGTLKNNMAFYSRFTNTHTDGYKYNSGSDSYSLFFSAGYLGTKDMLKITAFSGKTQNGQSYEHVPLSLIKMDPRTNFNNLNDIDDFDQRMAQVQYARQINASSSLHTTIYYNGAGGVFPYTFDGVQYMYGLDNSHYGAMFNYKIDNTQSTWNMGLHAYTFDRTNYEYVSPFVTEPYSRDFTDKRELSSFINYNRQLGPVNAYANVHLRTLTMSNYQDQTIHGTADNLFDESYTFLNTVVGLSHDLDQSNHLYASWGRTGREPTRTDIVNGVMLSEHVSDIEIGWRHLSSHFSVSANFFNMKFKNEIAKIGALVDRSYMEIRQNVPESRRSGIEVLSHYLLSDKIKLSLTAAYMNTNIGSYESSGISFTNVRHILAPDWIIQPTVDFDISDHTSLALSSRYVSQSFAELSNDPAFLVPSHFITNARIKTTLLKNFNLTLVGNNLFNVLYFTEGSPIDVDYNGEVDGMGFRVQPPRNIYVMLSLTF